MHSLLLVDDQMTFRAGLRRIIDDWDDFCVVAEAANGHDAIELACEFEPSIVLMDLNMPEMDGVEAVRAIHERLPHVRCVMLTVSEDEGGLTEAVRAGASGYLLKDTPIRRLHDHLRSVMDGEAPLSTKMATKVLEGMREGSLGRKEHAFDFTTSPNLIGSLTQREREVLVLLAEGLSNQEIAQRLFLSEKTVKKHLNSTFTKLNVSNRAQAAVYAIRAGLA